MGNHEKALHFASLHLNISKKLNDPMGQATAQMNVTDLKKILGLDKGDEEVESGNGMRLNPTAKASAMAASSPGRYRLRRQSMDNLDLIKVNMEVAIRYALHILSDCQYSIGRYTL